MSSGPLLMYASSYSQQAVELYVFVGSDNPNPGGDSYVEQTGMLVGNFEFNP